MRTAHSHSWPNNLGCSPWRPVIDFLQDGSAIDVVERWMATPLGVALFIVMRDLTDRDRQTKIMHIDVHCYERLLCSVVIGVASLNPTASTGSGLEFA
jgi:hypothetical protein